MTADFTGVSNLDTAAQRFGITLPRHLKTASARMKYQLQIAVLDDDQN